MKKLMGKTVDITCHLLQRGGGKSRIMFAISLSKESLNRYRRN